MNLFHILQRKENNSNENQERANSHLVQTLNRYSLVFHALASCLLVFIIEICSRRSLIGACQFIGGHTFAFFFDALIIFTTLTVVYLFRRRALLRIIICSCWLLLGIVNGCVLSQRVTPFGYTDFKCVSDLLTMSNSQYFSQFQAISFVVLLACLSAFLVYFGIKGPKFSGQTHRIRAAVLCMGMVFVLPFLTAAAQKSNHLASYFANIAQGYSDYGFVYGFTSSVVGCGMEEPKNYSEETIKTIENRVASTITENTSRKVAKAENVSLDTSTAQNPNVITILLESFMDPTEIKFLNFSEDPVPNFHKLMKKYTSGYLTVPVVGAGTANSEFEVLTGMNLRYFGTGEYPYKTILKKTDCESVASDLSKIGYGTHVVHNNGGNFYSRANAFSQFGFDTFTSKELMNIQEYTPLGSWPTDDILIDETIKALDSTPGQSDFVYTITVQGHGAYPEEKVIENPEIKVSGAATEALNNQWEYYVNEIHEVDKFIGNLTKELDKRDEDTMVVMFGDHLPTMGLTDDDMKSGDIFKTRYATWNNFGLKAKDADITSYQLLAYTLGQAGIHEGSIFTYHQASNFQAASEDYQNGLENLQYDILYGKRYLYNGEDKYPATDLQMGIDKTHIYSYRTNNDGSISIYGDHFTNWSRIFINDEKASTQFVSDQQVILTADSAESLTDGDILKVCQLGSGGTVFRTTENSLVYHAAAGADEAEHE